MVLTRSWRFTAAMSGGLWNRAPVKHSRACREQHKTLRISLRRPEDIHTVRVCVQMCSALLRWNQALQTCTILLPSGCRRTLQRRARDQRERRPGYTQRMDKTRSSSHTTANRRANNLHYLLSEEKYSRLQKNTRILSSIQMWLKRQHLQHIVENHKQLVYFLPH